MISVPDARGFALESHNKDSSVGCLRIRCLCLQKLPPSRIIPEIRSLNIRDWVTFQEWFVQTCFTNDYYVQRGGMSCFLGDVLYWKNLLHKCVKISNGAMSEGMAEALIALDGLLESENLVQGSSSLSCWLSKTYMYGTKDSKSLARELKITSNSNMFQGSTGCFEWDAGYYLAEYIMNNPEEFRERVCIELGCGCGMVGIILSRLKGVAGPVICTDGDWETLGNCADNMKNNNITVVNKEEENEGVILLQFQWENGWSSIEKQIEHLLFAQGKEQDDKTLYAPVSLVGADLLYDPEIIPIIVPLIADFLESMHSKKYHKEPDCSVYLSTKKRSEYTLQKFMDAVEAHHSLNIEYIKNNLPSDSSSKHAWQFFHIPSLDQSREEGSIVLHKISYIGPTNICQEET